MAPGGRDLRVNLISDLSKFTRGLRSGESDLQSFSGRVKTIATGVGAALLAGFSVGVIKDQIGQAISAASNLAESMSKVNVVFGSSASSVVQWSKTSAKSLLLSQQAALEAVGTFGNLFQAFGLTRDKSAEMSKTLVQLAADLASFNNTSVQAALDALQSGVSGEAEPLKRYGVALTDVRLRAEAMAQGIYDGTGVLDVAQKAQASYALILKDTALAQGDVARTSDGYANTMRSLSAAFENAQATAGRGFLTAINDVSEAIGGSDGLVDGMTAASKVVSGLASGFGDATATMIDLTQATNDWVKSLTNGDLDLIGLYKLAPVFGGIINTTEQLVEVVDDNAEAMERQGLAAQAFGQDAEDLTSIHRALAGQTYATAAAFDREGGAAGAAADELKKIEVGAVDAKTALQRLQEGLEGIFSSAGSFGKAQEKFAEGIAWTKLLAEGPGKSGSKTVTSLVPGKPTEAANGHYDANGKWVPNMVPGKPVEKTQTVNYSTPADYLAYANQIVSQAVATAKTLGPKAANKLLQKAQDRVAKLLAKAGYDDARAQAAALIGPINTNPNPRPWENMYRDDASTAGWDPVRHSTQTRHNTSRADSRSAQRAARTNTRP